MSKWKTIRHGKNSHSHTFSITISAGGTHGHGSGATGSTNCGSGSTHTHGVTVTSGGAHTHVFSGTTSVTSAIDLNHTHTVSVTSGSGSSHNHSNGTFTGLSGCAYGDCYLDPHRHGVSGLWGSEATHTHTLSGTTGTGTGTLEAHTHPISLTSSAGSSHTHGAGTLVISSGICTWGYTHGHAAPSASGSEASHTHSVSGNTDTGGEPCVTIGADWDAEVESSGITGATSTTLRVGMLATLQWRSAFRFPLTSLPAGSTVTQVVFKGYCDTAGGALHLTDVHPYNGDGQANPAGDPGTTLYARCAAGSPYIDDSTELRTTGEKLFTLGGTVCADVQNAKAAVDRFSLGVHEEGDDDDAARLRSLEYPYTSQLIVWYTVPAPPVKAGLNVPQALEIILGDEG